MGRMWTMCTQLFLQNNEIPELWYQPVTLLSLLGSWVVTGSVALEGWLVPALLTALTLNW